MKNSGTFEEQTEEIVEALLSAFIHKKTETTFRGLRLQGSIQVCQTGAEGAKASPTFDPVAIANHLRRVADKYNADLEEPVRNIIAESANKQVEKFGETVESLIKTWPNPYELQYEKAFLAISVKLFVYLAQRAPKIAQSNLLTRAINGNPEVRQYIEHQGGWENLRG